MLILPHPSTYINCVVETALFHTLRVNEQILGWRVRPSKACTYIQHTKRTDTHDPNHRLRGHKPSVS